RGKSVRVWYAGTEQARAGAQAGAQDGSGGDHGPGSTGAEADSLPREDPKLLVPIDAVVKRNGQAHVFVVEGDVVKLRAIRTGAERAGKIAVVEGLTSGDRIVIAPPPTLEDGDRVRTDT